jgi:farnesyl-diphosphate farnesyltransferase
VFKFCAIPQVMAIATLDLCYNNYEVFKREIKIRKGLAVKVGIVVLSLPVSLIPSLIFFNTL